VLVALDATQAVVNEAVAGGYDFLVTHHPLIYSPLKKITSADSTGKKILALIENKIGYYAAHTNLDKAMGGVNDCIAEKIGLVDTVPLVPDGDLEMEEIGIGRVAALQETTLGELAERVKAALGLASVRVCGDIRKKIKKAAVCGGDGSGSRYIEAAIKNACDVYITGDLRYHAVQEALEQGLAFIDITHYGGEAIIVEEIVSRLKRHVAAVASSIDGQVFSTL